MKTRVQQKEARVPKKKEEMCDVPDDLIDRGQPVRDPIKVCELCSVAYQVRFRKEHLDKCSGRKK